MLKHDLISCMIYIGDKQNFLLKSYTEHHYLVFVSPSFWLHLVTFISDMLILRKSPVAAKH